MKKYLVTFTEVYKVEAVDEREALSVATEASYFHRNAYETAEFHSETELVEELSDV